MNNSTDRNVFQCSVMSFLFFKDYIHFSCLSVLSFNYLIHQISQCELKSSSILFKLNESTKKHHYIRSKHLLSSEKNKLLNIYSHSRFIFKKCRGLRMKFGVFFLINFFFFGKQSLKMMHIISSHTCVVSDF